MSDSQDQNPKQQVEAASKAFEQEFERFVRSTEDSSAVVGLTLEEAIAKERELADLRTRHLGKKSALASTKKLIGRVPAEERASFGQLVQAAEAAVVTKIDAASQSLSRFIELQRTARESI